MKVWAAGGGNVSAKTQAKAAKALEEWEALKSKAGSSKKAALSDIQRAADLVSLSAFEDLSLRLSVEVGYTVGPIALSRVLDHASRL